MNDPLPQLAALVKAETGRQLADARLSTLATVGVGDGRRTRSRRGGRSGCPHLSRETSDGVHFRRLIDRIITDESSWFRYPDHFETLTEYVLPASVSRASFTGESSIRILSADVVCGQEPYSIAMAIDANPKVGRARP